MTDEELAEIAANAEADRSEFWCPSFADEIWENHAFGEDGDPGSLTLAVVAQDNTIPLEMRHWLQKADHPYLHWLPEEFHEDEAVRRVRELVPVWEAILGEVFDPPEYYKGDCCLFEIEITQESILPHRREIVIGLSFSKFGDLFTLYEHWIGEKQNPVTRHQCERMIALTEASGFHYVDIASLSQPYTGRNLRAAYDKMKWGSRFGLPSASSLTTPGSQDLATPDLQPPSLENISVQETWERLPQQILLYLRRPGRWRNEEIRWLHELVENAEIREGLSEYLPRLDWGNLDLDYHSLNLILPSEKGVRGDRRFIIFALDHDRFAIRFLDHRAGRTRRSRYLGETNAAGLVERVRSENMSD